MTGTTVAPPLWERVDGPKGKNSTLAFNFHPGQAEAWAKTERFVTVIAGSQSGKALALDTEIPTPDGFRTMADLRVGDQVYAEDGSITTITFVSSVFLDHPCYRLTFDDGSTVIADAEHRWVTRSSAQRKASRRLRTPMGRGWPKRTVPDYGVVTTAEIAARVSDKRGACNHAIDLTGPVEGRHLDLPIDPYVLGAWLGDGHSDSAVITSADTEIMNEIVNAGVAVSAGRAGNSGKALLYQIGSVRQGKGGGLGQERDKATGRLLSTGGLRSQLQTLGVLDNKHIPESYLRADREQRLALLQGLMDTDGYASPGGDCEYTTVLERLAQNVLELVRSLGVKGRIKSKIPTINGKAYRRAYRITFSTAELVFRLQRKRDRLPSNTRLDTHRRYITKCEPVESVPTRCIAVNAPSHQFLCTRSYIPTHNTSWGPIWLWREIQQCGSGDYLAVTASYDLFQLKMLPELRNFFEHLLGIATYRASERVLQLSSPPDTRIILRSASSPEGLESSTAKAAWCDEAGQEAFTLSAWEAVQRRTALHRGRILITTTPYLENWLKFDVYDKWAIDHDPDYAVVNFPSTFNPVYPKEEFDRAKRTWPTWKFNLFILGTFDRPAGLIYDCFNTDEHVVDGFDLPASWPRWVGIDFGAVNHAMVWVALNPETQVMYVYREELSSDATTPERARAALAYAKRENVVGWYGGAKSERQYRSDWRAAGVHIRQPLVSDVEAGIDAVTSVIKEDRLRVFRSCTRFRDEIGSYRRKLDDRGNPTVEILNKSSYHELDALRYIVPSVGRKRLAKVIPFGMPRPSPWNQMRARA